MFHLSGITKAFLQFSLAERDRDAVRFLWRNRFPKPNKETDLRTMRMTRVLFGASSSLFLLAATIKHNLKQNKDTNPEVEHMLSETLYVDNFIIGADSVDTAYHIYYSEGNTADRRNVSMQVDNKLEGVTGTMAGQCNKQTCRD